MNIKHFTKEFRIRNILQDKSDQRGRMEKIDNQSVASATVIDKSYSAVNFYFMRSMNSLFHFFNGETHCKMGKEREREREKKTGWIFIHGEENGLEVRPSSYCLRSDDNFQVLTLLILSKARIRNLMRQQATTSKAYSKYMQYMAIYWFLVNVIKLSQGFIKLLDSLSPWCCILIRCIVLLCIV